MPVPNRRPKLEIVAPSASPEEAAAVVAAVERFLRDTAPPPAPADDRPAGWLRAARLEAVEQPRDVGIAAGRALGHRAERDAARPCIAEDAQRVVLLGGDSGRLEHRGQLVDELSRYVLEEEVDLPLRCLHGLETPGALRAAARRSVVG